MSYVFYDTETTGLSPQFDQIIQFAAIKTDHNFNEQDRVNLRCRVQPHLIPSASALAINGVSLDQCFDIGLPSHYEMLSKLEKILLDWSPSVFAGWNSIKFDEEFLRYGFYQCLIQSFLTSLHQNSRLDILKIAQASHSYDPECLLVPKNDKGNFTFALDQLVRKNGHIPAQAHDAMSDVQSTIHIAKKLKNNAPHIWSHAVKYSNKATVNTELGSGDPFILTESFQNRRDQYVVVKVGCDENIPNQHFVADLRRDYSKFLDKETNEQVLWISDSPKPIRRVKATASPMLMPLEEVDEFQDLDIESAYQRANTITSNAELCSTLCKVYSDLSSREFSNDYVEQQLYDPIPDWSLVPFWQKFHEVPWHERTSVLKSLPDQRFRKLGLRLINEHQAESLDDKTQNTFKTFISRKLTGDGFGAVPWRNIEAAKQDLEKARKDPRIKHKVNFFDQYETYLNKLNEKYKKL